MTITVQDFKKLIKQAMKQGAFNNKGLKNAERALDKLSHKETGVVLELNLPLESGGYLLTMATLIKKYKEVEPVLIGKQKSFIYCG